MRCQRRPVMKFCLRTQSETVRQLIVGYANTARGKPIHGIGFVPRTYHEGRERKLHALRRIAFQDKAVERIEGLERLIELAVWANLREHPAFRRVRIDVAKMRKVRRIFEVAEGRHTMSIGVLR